MTGPFRGGTGGAGFGGAFAAMGDATSNFFEKQNAFEQQNEQKRQFDAQLAQNKANIELNQKKLQNDQYDRFDKGISTLTDYYQQNSKYMDPEAREAFGSMIQDGNSASMSYWGGNDESGLQAHAQKYGPGQAWGVDGAGNPITMDSVTASVNKNKPIIDLQEKLDATYGSTVATLASNALLDPDSPARDWALALGRGDFKGKPEEALAAAFASTTQGPKAMLSGLKKAGFSAEALSFADRMLKLLPKGAYSTTDDKGVSTNVPEYDVIMNLVNDPDNARRISEFRQGEDIQNGKGQILQYNTNSLAYDMGRWTASRTQFLAGKSDNADVANLIKEGDYANLSLPAGKAEYFRVYRIGQPNASDADIEVGYARDLGEAKRVNDQRQSVAAAQTTIIQNQALGSTMDTNQKSILFEALKPFLATDAVSQRNLQALVTSNSTTEAQFTAAVLPGMLQLKNDVDKTSMLRTLASAPGGVGRAAVRAALDSKLITQEQFNDLDSYAGNVQSLYTKGVNVQGMQLSADYMTAALSKQLSDAMIKAGVPAEQVKTQIAQLTAQAAASATAEQVSLGGQAGGFALGAATTMAGTSQANAQIQQALVQELLSRGQQPMAFNVGQSGMQTQLSTDNLTRITNNVNSNVQSAMLPYAALMGSTQARAGIQTGLASIASSMVQRYISEGSLKYARQLGASGATAQLSADDAARIKNDVQIAIDSGTLPFANAMGREQAKAALETAVTTSLSQVYNGDVLRGQTPYAYSIGIGTGKAAVAEQNLKLQTINNTIDLLPMQMKAQRQEYATAIANGQFNEALDILKKNNVNLDYSLTQGTTLQSLAAMDPKASLAGAIKDPRVRAMYQNAVRLQGEQRDLANQLAGLKVGGGGTAGSDVRTLNTALIRTRESITAITNSNSVKLAMATIKDLTGTTVAADAITGQSTIVVPADMTTKYPQFAGRLQDAYNTLETARVEANPLQVQAADLNQRIIAATVGQPNKAAVGLMQSLTTPGTNLAELGFTSDAVTAAPGLSNCSMFVRQAEAKAIGLPAYGPVMNSYFGGLAVQGTNSTYYKMDQKKAIYAKGMNQNGALSKLGQLKQGDVIFLDYGDPNIDHVVMYDGNGQIIQHSLSNFRGRTIQGNVNTMGIEEFIRKAGPNANISFGRIPEFAKDDTNGGGNTGGGNTGDTTKTPLTTTTGGKQPPPVTPKPGTQPPPVVVPKTTAGKPLPTTPTNVGPNQAALKAVPSFAPFGARAAEVAASLAKAAPGMRTISDQNMRAQAVRQFVLDSWKIPPSTDIGKLDRATRQYMDSQFNEIMKYLGGK